MSNNVSPRLLTGRAAVLLLSLFLLSTACKKEAVPQKSSLDSSTIAPVKLGLYKPKEMANMDWNSAASEWSLSRSKQSDHFILFWAQGYGTDLPSSSNVPEKYRVDIDDLLAKAEKFYHYYVDTLKFAVIGNKTSYLEKYKMMIFLYHQDDWLATGLGYDDIIGALWISPQTCQPVNATLAHEVGHCFQYQVSCDLGTSHGYRWGYGGDGGNTFWEQCAQWQAFKLYPDDVFGGWLGGYLDNYNKHILHEDYRYSSYFIHHYWTQKRGLDFIAKLWRQSQASEDAVQTYQRLANISNEQFNDEIYDASSRLVTWDIDDIRDGGKNYIGAQSYKVSRQSDGSFQPDPGFCPQTTGYNALPLNVPQAGTNISAAFKGIPNATGYNTVNASLAGYRYGFVALLNNGTRVYSTMYKKITDTAAFTVPADCARLWFVVTGAPSVYNQHAWDNNNANDEQWPYNVKFGNTNVYAYLNEGGNTDPTDIAFTYNVSVKNDPVNYNYTVVDLNNGDLPKLINAFQLNRDDITANMGSSIKFYAIEANGQLNGTTTANGYGHWFDASGNVIAWGTNAMVYSEFNEKNFQFTIGEYPGHVKVGDTFRISQALVYTNAGGKQAKATFTFNVSITN
ncbi:DUF4859 domain-containing protein [Chitinophaga silvisoli]|uniref:DUF4859 domain-containing protein n=1 Tax=Chitinophaga silvisoli TaxID=2291814 RepID=A0A3E1NU58_9BACT|nr:DUF4859 domain-containing protein [Chitinophaga silvisoli]RFM31485.1 DUF4859 domain-containing protein [Chitinophaga silvisoli]